MFLNVFHYFGFLLLKNEFVESLKSEVCHTFVTLKFFIGNVWISFHVTFCTTWNDSLWVVWPQWLLWHCEHILSLDMIGDHLNLQVWWQKFVNPYLLLNVYHLITPKSIFCENIYLGFNKNFLWRFKWNALALNHNLFQGICFVMHL